MIPARLQRLLGAVAVVAVLAVTLTRVIGGDEDRKTLTATFPSTISLYEGAKVKVLGVQVGEVTSIEVKGTAVEVEMAYHGISLPPDVHAMIVPPSIVGDRFVQLAPAYESGPTLPDGAALAEDHAHIPLELDDVYRGLDELTVALGPDGANRDGALSRLVSAGADQLRGNGRRFNTAIRELAGALDTLAASSPDLRGTIENLAGLNHTLAGKDAEIRAVVRNLATISATLNGQRSDIESSVRTLADALELVGQFTREHRGRLTRTVRRVAAITGTLAQNTAALTELADLAPVGLVSLGNIYVPRNWDTSRPFDFHLDGRVGSAAIRADLFSDLDTQLGFTLTAICGALPPAQATQLAPLCTALREAGGSLGGVLSALSHGEQPAPLAVTAADGLAGLLGGAR